MGNNMSKKQSLTDRLNRLNDGRCPIHGIWMSQVDGWYYPDDREPYTIVGCPRSDCEARAKANSFDGPWELLPECLYLLDERYAPPTPNRKETVSALPRAKKTEIWDKTEGRCYYCGLNLAQNNTFCVDHLFPQIKGGGHGIDNVVPSCRKCNSAKGAKTLEEFRFHRRMQKFAKQNGVWFTFAQVEYLKSIGVELDIPTHIFWFEIRESESYPESLAAPSGTG